MLKTLKVQGVLDEWGTNIHLHALIKKKAKRQSRVFA